MLIYERNRAHLRINIKHHLLQVFMDVGCSAGVQIYTPGVKWDRYFISDGDTQTKYIHCNNKLRYFIVAVHILAHLSCVFLTHCVTTSRELFGGVPHLKIAHDEFLPKNYVGLYNTAVWCLDRFSATVVKCLHSTFQFVSVTFAVIDLTSHGF